MNWSSQLHRMPTTPSIQLVLKSIYQNLIWVSYVVRVPVAIEHLRYQGSAAAAKFYSVQFRAFAFAALT